MAKLCKTLPLLHWFHGSTTENSAACSLPGLPPWPSYVDELSWHTLPWPHPLVLFHVAPCFSHKDLTKKKCFRHFRPLISTYIKSFLWEFSLNWESPWREHRCCHGSPSCLRESRKFLVKGCNSRDELHGGVAACDIFYIQFSEQRRKEHFVRRVSGYDTLCICIQVCE
jgi:hypothetical protein